MTLLFGNRSSLFEGSGDPEIGKKMLRTAIQRTAYLRNRSLHFTNKQVFTTALMHLDDNVSGPAHRAISDLWQADRDGRPAELKKTLHGIHCAHYFREDENRHIFEQTADFDPSLLILPRLRRVLLRTENAWKKEKGRPNLPAPANRRDLEDPARLCQYAVLKLLYERPFRHWFETCTPREVNNYIDRAVKRADLAAKNMNARGKSEEARALITARADKLPKLSGTAETIHDFFFRLSAATATEMRVQRGYDSDADKAREQADYIEDLKCDVVALAFADYLEKANFGFVMALKPETPLPSDPLFDLDTLEAPAPAGEVAQGNWQATLYFVLHLIPVDEVGRLLHQIRKWLVLEKKGARAPGSNPDPTVLDIVAVLELYLDMHDAKFEGEIGRASCRERV